MLCLTYQLIRQICSWTFRIYRWVRKNDKTVETIIQNHTSCDMKFLAQPKIQRHSSIIQSWPKVETIQMLIYWWISRQKLTQIWYPWKEAVDNYRRDGSTYTNLEHVILSTGSWTEKPSIVWFEFCEMLRIGKLIETENKSVATRKDEAVWDWLQIEEKFLYKANRNVIKYIYILVSLPD